MAAKDKRIIIYLLFLLRVVLVAAVFLLVVFLLVVVFFTAVFLLLAAICFFTSPGLSKISIPFLCPNKYKNLSQNSSFIFHDALVNNFVFGFSNSLLKVTNKFHKLISKCFLHFTAQKFSFLVIINQLLPI